MKQKRIVIFAIIITLSAADKAFDCKNIIPIEQRLISNEGVCGCMYEDKLGVKTIGIGQNLNTTEAQVKAQTLLNIDKDRMSKILLGTENLTIKEMKILYLDSIQTAKKQIKTEFTDFDSFNVNAQNVLIDVVFNMGLAKIKKKFPSFTAYMKQKDYASAAQELQFVEKGSTTQSDYCKQTKDRCIENFNILDQCTSGKKRILAQNTNLQHLFQCQNNNKCEVFNGLDSGYMSCLINCANEIPCLSSYLKNLGTCIKFSSDNSCIHFSKVIDEIDEQVKINKTDKSEYIKWRDQILIDDNYSSLAYTTLKKYEKQICSYEQVCYQSLLEYYNTDSSACADPLDRLISEQQINSREICKSQYINNKNKCLNSNDSAQPIENAKTFQVIPYFIISLSLSSLLL